MNAPVLLHGSLATHRRGTILQEAISATPSTALPDDKAVVLAFADAFQSSSKAEQVRLIEWTCAPGHLLLLLPPFSVECCEEPVSWRAERVESAPRGGEGLAAMLASEVGYRLTGKLQTPAVPGATWSDLSVCVGSYRLHPAAGLFAVTCLPLWSLAVLDAPEELESWPVNLLTLAGESLPAKTRTETALLPDHYGFLVFLLSESFADEEQAIGGLCSSSVFRFSPERGRLLVKELNDRGLVNGVVPTSEAHELVMQSPYAPYVNALRKVTNR